MSGKRQAVRWLSLVPIMSCIILVVCFMADKTLFADAQSTRSRAGIEQSGNEWPPSLGDNNNDTGYVIRDINGEEEDDDSGESNAVISPNDSEEGDVNTVAEEEPVVDPALGFSLDGQWGVLNYKNYMWMRMSANSTKPYSSDTGYDSVTFIKQSDGKYRVCVNGREISGLSAGTSSGSTDEYTVEVVSAEYPYKIKLRTTRKSFLSSTDYYLRLSASSNVTASLLKKNSANTADVEMTLYRLHDIPLFCYLYSDHTKEFTPSKDGIQGDSQYWYSVGEGTIDIEGLPYPKEGGDKLNYSDYGDVMHTPTEFSDMKLDNGVTYKFDPRLSRNNTYKIVWVVASPASGAGGIPIGGTSVTTQVAAGHFTYHLDGYIIVRDDSVYNIQYNVAYNNSGWIPVRDNIRVPNGRPIGNYAPPDWNGFEVREGWHFDGTWYVDPACTIKYDKAYAEYVLSSGTVGDPNVSEDEYPFIMEDGQLKLYSRLYDTPQIELPGTGGIGMYTYYTVACLAIFVALVVAYEFSKSKSCK